MRLHNLLYLFIIAMAISCKSGDDIAPVYKTSVLNVVNADVNALNIYQNGTRLNNNSPIGSGSASGYMSVKYGEQKYQLKIADPNKPDYIISDYTLTLDTLKSYSLFVAGETPDKLFLIDDVPPASSTQPAIRFVNTLPGNVNLNVTIGSASFTNVPFKIASGFINVNTGVNAIKIYQAGSATPIVDDVLNLTGGSVYTVFTTGSISGTGSNKLTAKLMLNSQ